MIHLTTEQLAERWHIKPKTLSNWRVSGMGPKFLKIGQRVLYSMGEIEAYEISHTLSNTQQHDVTSV